MGDLLVPYSLSDLLGTKIEKTLRISQRGGMDNKSNLFANNMSKRITANIVNMDGKTKSLLIILSNLGGNQGRSPRIVL